MIFVVGVFNEPVIHQGCRILEEEASQGRGGLETRRDVLIRGLWKIQTDTIINVRFGDANTDIYKNEPMDNLLARWDKENK